MSDILLTEDRGRVRILTLNRPQRKNAFNDDLYDALRDALSAAADDNAVAVVVLTGTEGAFSAGQDLSQMTALAQVDADGRPRGFRPYVDVLQEFPKPLLAAVNGVAVGIGVTSLLHCDLVWAAESARFRAPFTSLGIVTEAGSSLLFPAQMGWYDTAHFLYTSAFASAEDAQRMGLVWRVSPDARLMDDVMEVASQIATMPVSTLMANKRLLLEARLDAVKAARLREETALASVAGSPANLEAIAAFMEKRQPDFSNL